MTSSSPVRRIAGIVDVVAASLNGLSLAQISSTASIPLSTTHRTVQILMDIGYLSLDPATKLYVIGDRLKRVFILSLGGGSLEQLARPILANLSERFTETAYLAQVATSGPKLVDYSFPTRGPRTLVHPGFEFPIHATAVGKAIYAHQPEAVVEAEIAGGLKKYLENTVTSPKALRKILKDVRKAGFSTDDMELDPGVYALAVPLILESIGVVGAIAIAGIRERMLRRHSVEEIATALQQAAAEISKLSSATLANKALYQVLQMETHKVLRDYEAV